MTKNIKKTLSILLICIFLYGLAYFFFYKKVNNRDKVEITFDQSSTFSEKELNAATDKIISYFNVHWNGAKLRTITFDNALYEIEIAITNGDGQTAYSDIPSEHVLIFTTSFNTGYSTDGSVPENEEVSDWKIILSRKNKKSSWEIIDQGVG